MVVTALRLLGCTAMVVEAPRSEGEDWSNMQTRMALLQTTLWLGMAYTRAHRPRE